MNKVRLYDIIWSTKFGGPSPCGVRTELYFGGCKKALEGNPCNGCFNPKLWDNLKCIPKDPQEIVNLLNAHNIPKYITVVGGEPTDQINGLIDLTKLLQENGYHIILFSYKKLLELQKEPYADIFKYIDILIDGEYDSSKRIYDDHIPGIYKTIGSKNQCIFDVKTSKYVPAGNVLKFAINNDNSTLLELKNGNKL